MPPTNLRSSIEALLFSSDQPLTLALVSDALESSPEDVSAALQALADEYTAREAGVELRQIAGGWIVTTRPEHLEWIGRMLRGKRKMRLSRAALETMAIVAYKQPVTKGEIEAIRGVDASGVLATLLERNLVTIKGRSTVVGRPLLYGTTSEFLNYFGLGDLSELPRPEELRALVAAREPEQLEMMELDPESGMPLALAQANGAPAAGETATAVEDVPPATGEDAHESAAERFSLADADAAIAQANAARAEAASAMLDETVPDFAGASDLAEASDAGADAADEEYDDDEFEDDDDEFDDAYDEDDEDEDGDGDEDADRAPAVLDEHGGH
jgi:segregation and condensation protein B